MLPRPLCLKKITKSKTWETEILGKNGPAMDLPCPNVDLQLKVPTDHEPER